MDTEITIYQKSQELVPLSSPEEIFIATWLKQKCRSVASRNAYRYVIDKFQEELDAKGFSLFVPKSISLEERETLRIALETIAEQFVRTSYDTKKRRVKDGRLAEGSVNQRLAILNSFYAYAVRKNVSVVNPVMGIDPEKKNVHNAASALASEDVDTLLAAIDRSTLRGKRDYAILLLAVTTGRRALELMKLTWGDMVFSGKKKRCIVTWEAKGNKTIQDVLGEKTLHALMLWLHAWYGQELGSVPANAPVFVSLSHNPAYRGKALSSQALSDIWEEHGFTSKKHTTRHTFAVNAERVGLTVSELKIRLGHSDEKTTRGYLEKQHSPENRVINSLESLYGI